MARAAPTAEGYQEQEACPRCRGNGRTIHRIAPDAFWPRGATWLGQSPAGDVAYALVDCRHCRGTGFLCGPSMPQVLAWASADGFRWPQARVGHPVRGSVWREDRCIEGDVASGTLTA